MVVVLIDEYDAPIKEAIFEFGKEIYKIVHFIKTFFSNLLKINDNVERAFLNACVRPVSYTHLDVYKRQVL